MEAEEEDEDYKLIDRLLYSKTPSKLIYNILIKEKSETPTEALTWWKNMLNIATEEKMILKSQSDQRKLILNNKIKSFNYKFLLKNIPYEARLYKMKIKANENCARCQVKKDLIHLYWSCLKTRRLWERLKHLIERHQLTPFPLST